MLRLSAFLLLGACSLGVIAGRSTYGGSLSSGNGGIAGLLGASRNGGLNGIGSMGAGNNGSNEAGGVSGAGAVNMQVFPYAPFLPNGGARSRSFGSGMGLAGFGGLSFGGQGEGRSGNSGSYGSSGGAGIAGIAGLSSGLRMLPRNGDGGSLVNIGPNVVDFVPLSMSSVRGFPTRPDTIPVNGMVAVGMNANAGGMGAGGINANAVAMGASGMNANAGGMGARSMNGNGGAVSAAGAGMGSMNAAAVNAVLNAVGMNTGTALNAGNTGIGTNTAAVDMGAAIVAMNTMAGAGRNAGMNGGMNGGRNSVLGGGMNDSVMRALGAGMGGGNAGVDGSTGGVNAPMVSVAMVPLAVAGNAGQMNLGGRGDAISGGIAGFGMQGLTYIGNGCYIDESGNIVKLGEGVVGVAGVAGAGNRGSGRRAGGKWKL